MTSDVGKPAATSSRLKAASQRILDKVVWSGNVEPRLDQDYLIKGLIDRGCVSLLYGPSNTGKSFLAIFMCHKAAKGEPVGKHKVRKKHRVFYIAAEGGQGFGNRVCALGDPEFWVLMAPTTLAGAASQSERLSEVLQHLVQIGGPLDLVVIDTLSRVMGGADENAAPDIADLMRNVSAIQAATGAHVMLVHHSGKDTAKGARGHSSLRAAVDTEIELSRDETGLITALLTKQRDGPTGIKFEYRLRQVELGRDQDGDPVTTCVVEPVDSGTGRGRLSEGQRRALDILAKLIEAVGEVVRKPQLPGVPVVPVDRWRQACLEDGSLSSSDNREAQLKAFRRAREDLVAGGFVCVREDLAWVVAE